MSKRLECQRTIFWRVVYIFLHPFCSTADQKTVLSLCLYHDIINCFYSWNNMSRNGTYVLILYEDFSNEFEDIPSSFLTSSFRISWYLFGSIYTVFFTRSNKHRFSITEVVLEVRQPCCLFCVGFFVLYFLFSWSGAGQITTRESLRKILGKRSNLGHVIWKVPESLLQSLIIRRRRVFISTFSWSKSKRCFIVNVFLACLI